MESINIFVLHEPLLPHSTVILQQIHISCYGYKIDTSHHPTPPKKKTPQNCSNEELNVVKTAAMELKLYI